MPTWAVEQFDIGGNIHYTVVSVKIKPEELDRNSIALYYLMPTKIILFSISHMFEEIGMGKVVIKSV